MTKKELERLAEVEKVIRGMAEEEGLKTTDIIFEVVPAQRVIEGMAYNFPRNFSHWSFGRDYERIKTIYSHTFSGIPYEQVWNLEPPRALLCETNPLALQILVLAHVYGHVDFFLANDYCKRGRANANIAEQARNAAERFREYEARYGSKEVEDVIDAGMSIMWHQDPDVFYDEPNDDELVRKQLIELEQVRFKAKQAQAGYKMDPKEKEFWEAKIRGLENKTPPRPTHDLLHYVIRNSPKPLKPWMQDVLSVVRSQARTLTPNGRTKMLNEGWATYWHINFMRRLFNMGLITPEERDQMRRFHVGVIAELKRKFNWYRVGLAFFENIRERWDKGQFGKEYDDCEDSRQRSDWDTKAGLGKEKIFEVRAHSNDRAAVENLFSDEFIRGQKIYVYREMPTSDSIDEVIVENRPNVVRAVLRRMLMSMSPPQITVENGNYDNQQLLHLKHHDTGFELDPTYRDLTLLKIFHLWGRRVLLETKVNDKDVTVTYDGHKHRIVH